MDDEQKTIDEIMRMSFILHDLNVGDSCIDEILEIIKRDSKDEIEYMSKVMSVIKVMQMLYVNGLLILPDYADEPTVQVNTEGE